MINNLFSVFDPRSSLLSLSWILIVLITIYLPKKIWKINNSIIKSVRLIVIKLRTEVKYSLSKREKGTENMIMIIFLFIVILNLVALYPQNFSPTSHLVINLPIALTFWIALIIYGWTKNINHILSHLVPQGTPGALIIFIVLIELTRNLIRPITLCVRLTANMIAGHLLITLLGNFFLRISIPASIAVIVVPILLSILESAVACIQAYVFMTLITLYTTELK